MKKNFLGLALVSLLVGCGDSSDNDSPKFANQAALGEALYSDTNLSLDGTQSCATCHGLENGLADNRTNDASVTLNGVTHPGAGSLGDNQTSIGDRNAPTAGYASFSPEFGHGTIARPSSQKQGTTPIDDYEGFFGGQFWDGRATDLAAQAGGPPTNPGEMNMPSKAAVVERIQENSDYVEAFENLFGTEIFNDVDQAYAKMAESIGEFEKTSEFSPFDSKYDRFLRGEYDNYVLTTAAAGRNLFFSSDLACAACHQLRASTISAQDEVFSSFQYHNIGVPENTHLRSFNGASGPDLGLGKGDNAEVPAEQLAAQEGKFKTPTLRNIAVTAPYMHNGVFNELETVILFYEHAKNRARGVDNNILNPETNLPFRDAEVSDNIAHNILRDNQTALSPTRVRQLECFLISLTDARYEHLLDQGKVASCGLNF